MKLFPFFLVSSLSLVSTFRLQAEVQEIPVDGTIQTFYENFDPSTYVRADYRWTGPIYDYEWVFPKGTGASDYKNSGFIHQSGNWFTSGNLFYADANARQYYGTSANMTRSMKYRIMGRDPNKTYRIIATQPYRIKTPDLRGDGDGPFWGGDEQTNTVFVIYCKGWVELSRDEWASGTRGIWSSDTASTQIRLTPDKCPANEFIVRTFVWQAQDVDFGPVELVVLEEGN